MKQMIYSAVLMVSVLCWGTMAWAIAPTTLQNAATSNGDGTTFNIATFSNLYVEVTMSGTAGRVSFERTVGTSGYQPITCMNVETNVQFSLVETSGNYNCTVSGSASFRAPITGCSACTVTVKATGSTGKAAVSIADVALSLATTTSASAISSTSGVPVGGFIPPDMDAGTFASRGCKIDMAGGNMGTSAFQGTNFLMACDMQDISGSFFKVWNNDTTSFPKSIFDIRRNGSVFGNALSIQQTQTYNQPVFYTPGGFNYGDAQGTWAAINVTSDVPGSLIPVLGIWGMVDQYGATKPPLIRAYGATLYSSGVGYTSGSLRAQLTDAGILTLGPMTTLTNLAAGELALENAKRLSWSNFDGTFSTTSGLRIDSNNNLGYTVPFSSGFHSFGWGVSADRFFLQFQNSGVGMTWFSESSADHAAPAANATTLYTKDDGAGNTVLTVRFNTGNPVLLATQNGKLTTQTNCSSAAAPAVCASASAGSVAIAAAATTVTVNTTAVTANSQILIMEDSSLGTKLGVTCNTTIARTYAVTARTAGTSFVITTSAAPVTNPACLSYLIMN